MVCHNFSCLVCGICISAYSLLSKILSSSVKQTNVETGLVFQFHFLFLLMNTDSREEVKKHYDRTIKSMEIEKSLHLITSKTGTSRRVGTFVLLFCDLEVVPDVCRILANLFCLLLQKFFTSLSVLPVKKDAILAHLFPNCACNSITILSSSSENLQPL